MNEQTITSAEADTRAAHAVERHHAVMAATLSRLVDDLVAATASGPASSNQRTRHEVVRWCRDELVPHALAEERTMYPAAHGIESGRLLIDGMLEEHKVIVGLVDEVDRADSPVAAAAAARALSTVFELHLGKENDLVLPLLLAADDVSVAELLGGMHELLGAGDAAVERHGHRYEH
jgi:iron-sulfur cluster repair protein YtfE (RIC family)